jgi:hypothetical protein
MKVIRGDVVLLDHPFSDASGWQAGGEMARADSTGRSGTLAVLPAKTPRFWQAGSSLAGRLGVSSSLTLRVGVKVPGRGGTPSVQRTVNLI